MRKFYKEEILNSDLIKKHLEIDTYHGFTWKILRSHGYLLNSKTPLKLLPPPEAASRLAEFDSKEARSTEMRRLFNEEGFLHFDLFAGLSAELLSKSKSLAEVICDAYPIIIFDEFQDTNDDEWKLIRVLGERCILIALADAEQRIYEFRGANPARIDDFIKAYDPTKYDFSNENHRSSGTDIMQFGNDLLSGANKGKTYRDVECLSYPSRRGVGVHLALKTTVLCSYKRLKDSGNKNWSLAILVPTKRLMLDVSAYLASKQRLTNSRILPIINHEVALEASGPSLAAVLIAGLMEGGETDNDVANRFIYDLCEHIRGRKGGNSPPSQVQLSLSIALMNYIDTKMIRGKNRRIIIDESLRIANECRRVNFSGDPAEDWLVVRNVLSNSQSEDMVRIADDAKYLRLLHKGALLRSRLAEIWRNNGNYFGAAEAVIDSLRQEHFSSSTKVWTGINVMTMHKAKGKEFDEVIIYEGLNQGKIVRDKADEKEIAQSRLKLRVSVTRAIKRTTILTPQFGACRFLQ